MNRVIFNNPQSTSLHNVAISLGSREPTNDSYISYCMVFDRAQRAEADHEELLAAAKDILSAVGLTGHPICDIMLAEFVKNIVPQFHVHNEAIVVRHTDKVTQKLVADILEDIAGGGRESAKFQFMDASHMYTFANIEGIRMVSFEGDVIVTFTHGHETRKTRTHEIPGNNHSVHPATLFGGVLFVDLAGSRENFIPFIGQYIDSLKPEERKDIKAVALRGIPLELIDTVLGINRNAGRDGLRFHSMRNMSTQDGFMSYRCVEPEVEQPQQRGQSYIHSPLYVSGDDGLL